MLITSIVALTTVSCMYHITYDAMLIWVAIVCLWFSPATIWPTHLNRLRFVVASLLFVPMINFLGTKTIVNSLLNWFPAISSLPATWQAAAWTFVCTLNGLALLVALLLLVIITYRFVSTTATKGSLCVSDR